MWISHLCLLQEIKKVGVGISGDAHKLQRDFGVPCAGLICLSDEANVRLCSPANGRAPQKWSLAGMLSLDHLQYSCHVYDLVGRIHRVGCC